MSPPAPIVTRTALSVYARVIMCYQTHSTVSSWIVMRCSRLSMDHQYLEDNVLICLSTIWVEFLSDVEIEWVKVTSWFLTSNKGGSTLRSKLVKSL